MPAVERDTGLGTTYERIAVARFTDDLAARQGLTSVLEGPLDGITGIRGLNSVPFALRGAAVEVLLTDPDEVDLARRIWARIPLPAAPVIRRASGWALDVPPASFDLVWNFNALPQAPDPEALMDEMCRASGRLVLAFVSNTLNYGFPVHRLHHRAAGEPWSHGSISVMSPSFVGRAFERRGFRVIARPFVDVPWWPDIDSPIEDVAATFLPFLRGRVKTSRRLERYTWDEHTLPYFDPQRRHALEADLARHAVIERSRFAPLKALFAHHRGVLAEKGAR